MKHYADMTEQERAQYKAQREQEARAMVAKQREEWKQRGQELATLQDMKADIFRKTAEYLRANDGKQFTKRTADALSKILGGITVHKVSDWSECLYIYIPDDAHRYTYEDTRVQIVMQLDNCKRIKGEQMAELLTRWAESSDNNANGDRATAKELERAIRDAAKIREMIKEYETKYSVHTRRFIECDLKR